MRTNTRHGPDKRKRKMPQFHFGRFVRVDTQESSLSRCADWGIAAVLPQATRSKLSRETCTRVSVSRLCTPSESHAVVVSLTTESLVLHVIVPLGDVAGQRWIQSCALTSTLTFVAISAAHSTLFGLHVNDLEGLPEFGRAASSLPLSGQAGDDFFSRSALLTAQIMDGHLRHADSQGRHLQEQEFVLVSIDAFSGAAGEELERLVNAWLKDATLSGA